MKVVAARSALVGALLSASPASACTLCHSMLAAQVRAIVLGPDFLANMGALLLPAPALTAAVLLARRFMP